MKATPPTVHRIKTLVVALSILCVPLLQGCDSVMSSNEPETRTTTTDAKRSTKLRHANLLDDAQRTTRGELGKTEAIATDLYLAFNEYEANGVTRRVLDKYEITNRILTEYGITRRVLSRYGITKRILNEYDITRRILNQYDVTRRILDKYGITPRVLSRYGDKVTEDLLQEHGVTETKLAEEGLSVADIDGFNELSALLNEHGVSIEQFISELESNVPSVRVKVQVDGAHLGMAVSVKSKYISEFLDEISDDSDILFAEPDVTIRVDDLGMIIGDDKKAQITPWGIAHIETPLVDKKDEKKADYQDVEVYIFDSGAIKKNGWDDLEFDEVKDFTMLFKNSGEALWDEDEAPDVSGFDPGKEGNPYDESGHGVHVAGTIGAKNDDIGVVGVASGIKLHSLKVLTKEGKTDITTLLAAVDYVTRAKKDKPKRAVVVNMSLGVDIGTTAYNVLDEAIEASIAEGVIYVVAAGNDGRDASTYSPAHVRDVITVGAYNQAEEFASFSNYGPTVDILAPGENILSLSHLASETKNAEAILASGTSYAAPHVTGAVARYLGIYPEATASEVANALKGSATATLTGLPGGTANRALNVSNLLSVAEDADDKKKKGKKK